MSITARTIALCIGLVALAGTLVSGQDRARYRDYRLGTSVATIASQTATPTEDVTTLHQRPALLQQLEWRPPYFLRDSTRQTDPVAKAVFSFYDDQLFSIVVDYDIERTEGLTHADLIDAISETYGAAMKTLPRRSVATDAAPSSAIPIAQWADADTTVTLLKSSYPIAFSLTVVSPRSAALARTESRGNHWRSDHPEPDEALRVRLVHSHA